MKYIFKYFKWAWVAPGYYLIVFLVMFFDFVWDLSWKRLKGTWQESWNLKEGMDSGGQAGWLVASVLGAVVWVVFVPFGILFLR